MKILRELISSLQGKDYAVKDVLTGAYWTAVISKGCGLASTLREESHPHKCRVKDAGRLAEKGALDLELCFV